MDEERVEGTDPQPEDDTRAPQRGRLRVALIAIAVLAVIAAAAVLSGDRQEALPPTDDPVAALDAALADGRPAFVLIHSLT